MKILLISRGVPSPSDPQWGIFELDQALALKEMGHEVTVASIDRRFRLRLRKIGITELEYKGLNCYNSYWLPFALLIRLLGSNITERIFSRQLLQLYKHIESITGKPDVIYSHYLANSHYALALKRKHGIPIVGIEHWSEIGKDQISPYAKTLGARTYQYLDSVLVVSKALQHNLKKFFNIESTVLNNMIGEEFFYKEYNSDTGKIRFITTGSLIPRKCVSNIIEAFKRANLDTESYEMLIIGSGSEQTHLQNQIKEAVLNRNIHLLGRRQRFEIVELLQSSDVYILASSSETFGVAAGEALACGLPVIATDCGGPGDFMTSFNGILIPTNDIDSLSNAITKMMTKAREYDRLKIAEDCHSKFSSHVIMSQLDRILRNTALKKHQI